LRLTDGHAAAERKLIMEANRIALVTGGNQGVGLQLTRELVASGVTVLLGSRNMERGQAAAREIGDGAIPIQIDVTDAASIAAAAERIRADWGRLDLLVNNAAISNTSAAGQSLADYSKATQASLISLDEVRAIWETNVFGVLAVYQAMLPLLRLGRDARIVNVSSTVGSLTTNADPAYPYRAVFSPGYAASKTALNGITLAMMIELEGSGIKVNLVSPGFTSTTLNNFEGTETLEQGSREVVRVALLGPDGPTNTYTEWENTNIPW
jgi:NAD(P)-dependent dehydrogenase (short-subunit alcohol dehydrogenase family)